MNLYQCEAKAQEIVVEGNIVATDTTTCAVAGYTISAASPVPNTIVFHSIESGGEILKIAQDGFYVRGEKIPQDDAEARTVYDAFISWLRTTGHAVGIMGPNVRIEGRGVTLPEAESRDSTASLSNE